MGIEKNVFSNSLSQPIGHRSSSRNTTSKYKSSSFRQPNKTSTDSCPAIITNEASSSINQNLFVKQIDRDNESSDERQNSFNSNELDVSNNNNEAFIFDQSCDNEAQFLETPARSIEIVQNDINKSNGQQISKQLIIYDNSKAQNYVFIDTERIPKNANVFITKQFKNIFSIGGSSTNNNANASQKLNQSAAIVDDNQTILDKYEEEDENQIQIDTFFPYKPKKLCSGQPHPDKIVESVSLNSVPLPAIKYHMQNIDELADAGKISNLQLEAAIYACQAHENFLLSGERVGYLIGDSPGVGKGRIIAAVMRENFLLERRRALWFSVSSDLIYDAERDLRDIDADIKVHLLSKMKYAKIDGPENNCINEGIIFSTYSSLISKAVDKDAKIGSRLEQLIQWCGKNFDGLIVFDECHHAKGLNKSETADCVLQLQTKLPKARIIYSSATGATHPSEMGYMTRLGLWGKGTAYPNFGYFCAAVENKGTSCIELIAIDMKLRGLYLARQLSFEGVDFNIHEILLSYDYIQMYNDSVKLWIELRRLLEYAIEYCRENNGQTFRNTWSLFWSAHQNFFKHLCIAAKVDECVKITKEALENGKSVIIGLQTTGEAQSNSILNSGDYCSNFVSTAKTILQEFITKHFPSDDSNDSIIQTRTKGQYVGQSRKRTFQDLTSVPPKKSPKILTPLQQESDEDFDLNMDFDEETQPTLDETILSSSSDDASDFDYDQLDTKVCTQQFNDTLATALLHEIDDGFNPFDCDFSKGDDPYLHLLQEMREPLTESEKTTKNKIDHQKRKQFRKVEREKRQKKFDLEQERQKRDQLLLDRKQKLKFVSAVNFIESSRIINYDLDMDNGPSLSEIKRQLLQAIDTLGRNLPSNTLDNLINQLGGPEKVAEMTGRKERFVMSNGVVKREKRNVGTEAALEKMNLEEKDNFMNGKKLVAIISDAASSGISLQADKRVQNQRRRLHITLELPWSADKAVQQFGRSHRSNQSSAPEYKVLISELAGEKRFISSVAKRLECLGAITRGDRHATEARNLSQFNLDNKYCREALRILFDSIISSKLDTNASCLPNYELGVDKFFEDMREYLVELEFLKVYKTAIGKRYSVAKDMHLEKFLNRLLGLPFHAQNALFAYFSDIANNLVKQAKIQGTFDSGILDLGDKNDKAIKIGNPQVYRGFLKNNSYVIEIHQIEAKRGINWQRAELINNAQTDSNCGFYLSKKVLGRKQAVVLVVQASSQEYATIRPNVGRALNLLTLEEVSEKFKEKLTVEQAKTIWEEHFEALETTCLHHFIAGTCQKQKTEDCDFGRRVRTYFVMTGSVIALWPEIEKKLKTQKKHIPPMKIVRVSTNDDQKLIGLLVPSHDVESISDALKKLCK